MVRSLILTGILLGQSWCALGQTGADSLRNVDLEAVLVVAEPIDKAYEVLREAGRRNQPLPSFQCSTAVKSTVGSGGAIQLREALSISRFAAPNRFSESVYLADEHSARGLNDGRSVQVQFSVGRDDGAAPEQRFQSLGKHFFESYPDGNLDLYRPTMELPRLMAAAIPSPLAADVTL